MENYWERRDLGMDWIWRLSPEAKESPGIMLKGERRQA
jgi:hypothetical protein